MKRYLFWAMSIATLQVCAENLHISTPNSSLLLIADEGRPLCQSYYGSRLSSEEATTAFEVERPIAAYPSYGQGITQNETALAVRHADGNMTLDMVVDKVQRESADTKYATHTQAPVAGNGESQIIRITLRDKVYPFVVDLCYKTYDDNDVIETWTEIRHQEKGSVTLNQYASAYMPVRQGNVWVSHLHGTWANEANLVQEPLNRGLFVVKNKDGMRNSHTDHAEIMLSLDGEPQENNGRTIAAALCYSGNYKLRIDTDDSQYHHFLAGINEENSSYELKKNEQFTTPVLAFTYSDEGMSGASRNIHRWARGYRMAHGYTDRRVLLNSWEGVYFDINEPGMAQMMGDIADMNGELFVMDDGWFGDKYPRNNDTSSLGDWVVDRSKLSSGVARLVEMADSCGVKFGIWIEPEYCNTVSELYEKHPDWVIKAEGRDVVLGRGGTQCTLDLSNPDVQDFVFGVVDRIMTENPQIVYIKWDANMNLSAHGSQYLPKDKQNHLYIEQHKGFAKVCDRVRAKYPNLVIQACASGGGRANYGVLPWFDEFWVSDNNDALQRIYMQWGTSLFFPASLMASHISASPGHQTHRLVPIKFRADVAMSGRLGMEIQPENMTEDEKKFCRKAIENYKRIRPIVQHGDIYRLKSPYDHDGVASLMYVSPSKDEAVFYWWRTEYLYQHHMPRIAMCGLDPDKMYIVEELNRLDDNCPIPQEGKVFSGAFLMANGLDLPETISPDDKAEAFHSRVIHIREK